MSLWSSWSPTAVTVSPSVVVTSVQTPQPATTATATAVSTTPTLWEAVRRWVAVYLHWDRVQCEVKHVLSFARSHKKGLLIVVAVLCACRYWLVLRARSGRRSRSRSGRPHSLDDDGQQKLSSNDGSSVSSPTAGVAAGGGSEQHHSNPNNHNGDVTPRSYFFPVSATSSSSSRIRRAHPHSHHEGGQSTSQATTPRTEGGEPSSQLLNRAVEELLRCREPRRVAVDEQGAMFVLINRGEFVEIYDADENGEIRGDEDPQSDAHFTELLEHFSREASLAVSSP